MVCNYCHNFHKTATIAANEGGTELVITFADTPTTVTNENHFCFIVCQNIPEASKQLPVSVTVDGVAVPLLDRYGNLVPGCGLQKGRIYKGYYGTTGIGSTAEAPVPHVLSYSLPTGCVRSYPCSITLG